MGSEAKKVRVGTGTEKIIYPGRHAKVPAYFCFAGVTFNTAPFILQSVLIWTLSYMVKLRMTLASWSPGLCDRREQSCRSSWA